MDYTVKTKQNLTRLDLLFKSYGSKSSPNCVSVCDIRPVSCHSHVNCKTKNIFKTVKLSALKLVLSDAALKIGLQ